METNGYELSRNWFDWSFENPEKISPNHSAIYFFAIEHCNRLGWKDKFGFPTQMVMDAIGIKKHQTYIKYFNELVEWGFFKLVQKSTNQYSANIISIKCAVLKNGKALDKAFIKHRAKQTQTNGQSIGQSNSSVDKQLNKEQDITLRSIEFKKTIYPFVEKYTAKTCEAFYDYWSEPNKNGKMKFELQKTWEVSRRLKTWVKNEDVFNPKPQPDFNPIQGTL